jgi:hypothetical protein
MLGYFVPDKISSASHFITCVPDWCFEYLTSCIKLRDLRACSLNSILGRSTSFLLIDFASVIKAGKLASQQFQTYSISGTRHWTCSGYSASSWDELLAVCMS